MYQGDRPDLTDKMNLVAQRQRRSQGQLATDVVARSSYPDVGALVVGYGPGRPDPLPLGEEGTVLTASPREFGGVRWAKPIIGGEEIDSDNQNNVWEGPGALAAKTTGHRNTAMGWHALHTNTSDNDLTGIGNEAAASGTGATAVGSFAIANAEQSVAVGYGATASASGALCVGGAGAAATGFRAVAIQGFASGLESMALGDGAGATGNHALALLGTASAAGAVAIGSDHTGTSAVSATQDLIVLGTSRHTTQIPGLPAFAAGDQYLVVDAGGNVHKSALGPAS